MWNCEVGWKIALATNEYLYTKFNNKTHESANTLIPLKAESTPSLCPCSWVDLWIDRKILYTSKCFREIIVVEVYSQVTRVRLRIG